MPKPLVSYLGAPAVTPSRVCRCGEPEDGGDFGWFDHPTDGLRCNRCGEPPLDATDLRPDYAFDYTRAKPNRFVRERG
jgi:hypothetical protein